MTSLGLPKFLFKETFLYVLGLSWVSNGLVPVVGMDVGEDDEDGPGIGHESRVLCVDVMVSPEVSVSLERRRRYLRTGDRATDRNFRDSCNKVLGSR